MNKYQTFEHWFDELEGFNTRGERCYEEHEVQRNLAPLKNLRKWMEQAFYAGRLQHRYTLQVEGDSEDMFIQFPDEVLKSQGWQEGTILSWHDNGDGTWTIKAKQ